MRRRPRRPRSRGHRIARAGLWLGLGLLLWSGWVEPRMMVVRSRTVPSGPWHGAPLRVALVGDLHVGAPPMDRGRLRDVIERINDEGADLVLFLGDLVDTKSVFRRDISPRAIGEDLAHLSAPLGVFAVLGNHDHWFGAERVRDALERADIPVLSNTSRPLRPSSPFRLVGVDDEFTGHDDLDRALAEVPRGMDTLLATHTPDLFPRVPDHVALTVAAHTHGGQIRLPGAGPLFVPSRYGDRYARGLVREGGKALYVTSGVGTSMVPVRLGVPPELIVLELRAARP